MTIDELQKALLQRADTLNDTAKIAVREIRAVLYHDRQLPSTCPSRASAAEMELRVVKQNCEDVRDIVADLEEAIFAEFSDKR